MVTAGRGACGIDAVLAVGDLEPAVQAGFGDSEILRDLTDGGFALTGHGDDVAAELFGKCFRHGKHPFTVRYEPHRSDVNQTPGSPVHISNLVGALNQIDCGTTTLGDWCHNNPTPDHSDAAVAALQGAGIRAVFLHGSPDRAPDVAHPLDEVDRLIGVTSANTSLMNVGMAILGPQLSTPEVAVADFRAARERGIVASMHQSGGVSLPPHGTSSGGPGSSGPPPTSCTARA
jgi:hypothetical protein